MIAREITLTLHLDEDGCWVETPDGYYAGSETLPGLLALIAEGLPFHLGYDDRPLPAATTPLVYDGSSPTVGSPGRLHLA